MVIKLYAMDDIGTRAEHLADVQDLWGMALCILTTGTYHSDEERKQVKELETALKLLENHMTHNFDQTGYARTINDLPWNAEDIPD